MAIKISGTNVISDTRALTNIAGATGVYGNFHCAPIDITDNINFTSPMMTCTMTAATSFTESGYAEGRTATLLLDTSTNSYAPTFSANIVWKDNTTPTWGDYQHWQITFVCGDTSSTIYASAVGFTATSVPGPTETITLGGTTSTPITYADFPQAAPISIGWGFYANGNVYKMGSANLQVVKTTALYSSTQWCNVTPSTTYYIRVSNFAGGNNIDTSISASLNTWLALTTNRLFKYTDSRNITTYADEDGVIKVEIATDAAGSNIVATGYYRTFWTGTA